MTSDSSADIAISIRNLFKIFGNDPSSILPMLYDGIDKAEIQSKTGHVIGLNNINVDMLSGKITVIMGLSGSGKSTLIRHINRLIEPTAGEVLLDSNNILELDAIGFRKLRQTRMSMVFQKFALLPHRTVLENSMLAPMVRNEDKVKAEKEARNWLSRVELYGFEDSYPHQLSGGMQQRVGIARALTSNADIMLMDEAFSALDPLIRTSMQDLLLDLQKDLKKTIIFITHDLDEALKIADHLVVLKDGFVVQQGNQQEIILNPTDPYIEEFVSDINRARVLRVASIMDKTKSAKKVTDNIDGNASLEQLITQADGATDGIFAVTQEQKIIGHIQMSDVYRALVRYDKSDA
jgi:glycine betaine/proline transport system ATP-binding protein